MQTNKMFLKEVLGIGSAILILSLLIQNLRYSNIGFLNYFLPARTTIFEMMKGYFLAITLLIFIEYFIIIELPNNYLLSRVIGAFLMMILTTIIYLIFPKLFVNNLSLSFVILISILFGQVGSYFIQKIKIRWSYFLGFANYFIIAFLMFLFTLFPSGGLFL